MTPLVHRRLAKASPALLPSAPEKPSATRNLRISELTHTAHVLARLRIAVRSVAPDVARFATGPPCSTLAGRDLHPLDDVPHFYKVIVTFLPCGPAFPGRTPGVADRS
ncbi:MAG TPA: hypothetical protein VGO62_08805, partial [Myxococcota bacterium]